MIIYTKLAELLKARNMAWKDLRNAGLSQNMPTKLSLNRPVTVDVIDKVCAFLHCQPGDIMEWVESEDQLKEIELKRQIEALQKQLAELHNKAN